jgi:hypothetical protein
MREHRHGGGKRVGGVLCRREAGQFQVADVERQALDLFRNGSLTE